MFCKTCPNAYDVDPLHNKGTLQCRVEQPKVLVLRDSLVDIVSKTPHVVGGTQSAQLVKVADAELACHWPPVDAETGWCGKHPERIAAYEDAVDIAKRRQSLAKKATAKGTTTRQ